MTLYLIILFLKLLYFNYNIISVHQSSPPFKIYILKDTLPQTPNLMFVSISEDTILLLWYSVFNMVFYTVNIFNQIQKK